MIPKIFKISGYLIDPTGRLEPHHIKAKMLYGCGFPLVGQHIHVQKAEIKKLDEKHPLMQEKDESAHRSTGTFSCKWWEEELQYLEFCWI